MKDKISPLITLILLVSGSSGDCQNRIGGQRDFVRITPTAKEQANEPRFEERAGSSEIDVSPTKSYGADNNRSDHAAPCAKEASEETAVENLLANSAVILTNQKW